MAARDSEAGTANREIVATRIYGAPRELVWRVWTDPKHIAQWWGPQGFTNTIREMEVRPGGAWRFTMHGPDGKDYPNEIVFTEVMKPERLAYDHTAPKFQIPCHGDLRRGGRGQDEAHHAHGLHDICRARRHRPEVRRCRRLAADSQASCRLSRGRGMSDTAPMERELVLTRIFDAPRVLVWRAWTDPKHLAQWWGTQGFTNPVCEIDPRPGGALRIVMRAPDGVEYPMIGVFREISPPARLVFTNIAVDQAGKPILDGLTTVLFAEQGGKTKLTLQTRAAALVDYAAAYLAGMEAGWNQSLDRLADRLRPG